VLDEVTSDISRNRTKAEINGKQADKVCRLLTRLLSEELTKFQWPERLCPGGITAIQVWKSILLKCPKLHTLDVSDCPRYEVHYAEWSFYVNKMAHPRVQVLKLHYFSFDNKHLQAIAEHFPSLRLVL
jgi:hypothetical protein